MYAICDFEVNNFLRTINLDMVVELSERRNDKYSYHTFGIATTKYLCKAQPALRHVMWFEGEFLFFSYAREEIFATFIFMVVCGVK